MMKEILNFTFLMGYLEKGRQCNATIINRPAEFQTHRKHLLVAYSKEDSEIKIVTTFITSDAQQMVSRKLGKTWVKIR